MIIERKRLSDLEGALRKADEQIAHFRLSTKNTAVDLLNQHRFCAKPYQEFQLVVVLAIFHFLLEGIM